LDLLSRSYRTHPLDLGPPATPFVELGVSGPRGALVGRPAYFRLSVRSLLPGVRVIRVRYDPRASFLLRFRRPGRFRLRLSARVTFLWRSPRGPVIMSQTLSRFWPVEVFAPSVEG
jgi:hypothetical protein